MSKRYKVRTMPNSSDKDGESHLAIIGVDVDEFAVMERIAALIETVLNAADRFGSANQCLSTTHLHGGK